MFTLKQLTTNTPPEVRIRAKLCAHKLSKQAQGKGFIEYRYIVKCTDGNRNVIIRSYGGELVPMSNVWVSCSCPFWLFYCEWAVANRTGKPPSTDIIYSNGRPPYVRNPRFHPYLCKHLYRVSQHLKYVPPPGNKGRYIAPRGRGAGLELGLSRDIMVLLLQAPQPQRVIEEFTVDSATMHDVQEALTDLAHANYIKKVGAEWQLTEKGITFLAEEL